MIGQRFEEATIAEIMEAFSREFLEGGHLSRTSGVSIEYKENDSHSGSYQ